MIQNEICKKHGLPLIFCAPYYFKRCKYACKISTKPHLLLFCSQGLDEEWEAMKRMKQ
jgi:predicted solute-binding protein